jgi:apolipoprotein N-acyltransferase
MAHGFFGLPVWLQPGRRVTRAEFLRGAGLNILLVLLAAVLAARAVPPFGPWWLAWVALVPLLVALRRTTMVRASGYLMLLFAIAYTFCALPWMHNIFGAGALGIYLLIALPMILFGLAYRVLAGQGRAWVIIILTPVFWVAADWIRCEGWYFQFSWAQLGLAFTSASELTCWNIYSNMGVYGATFLFVLTNGILTEMILAKGKIARFIAWSAIVVVFMSIIGYMFPPPTPLVKYMIRRPREWTARPLTAVIVQDESGDFKRLRDLTLQQKSERPVLVVWPEFALPRYLLDEPALAGELQDVRALARELRCTLVLGCKERVPADAPCDALRRRAMRISEGNLFANAALVIGPDGRLLGTYHKQHPIQFFSDGVPGRKRGLFDTPAGRLGVAICYDFDFAGTARRLVHGGAQILVVPTYDAAGWSSLQHDQHAAIARARAAETSRWVVRATCSGFSQIIAPDGQDAVVIKNGESAAAAMPIGLMTDVTPYMRCGWLLPYLCLGIAGVWTVGTLMRRRKRNTATPETPNIPAAPSP